MNRHERYLQTLWQRGLDFLGSSNAFICGAMTWVSHHQLVAGVCEAGGFGLLAGGSLSPEKLAWEIQATKQRTHRPFGVNLIVFHPEINNLIDMCIQEKVTHVCLGGGIPAKSIFDKLNDHGIKSMAFAPSVAVGQRLISHGAGSLIIEGNEAGGHVGPVTTQVLAQEILPVLGEVVPIFVAGGIGNGHGIFSYLMLGASGCQMGSRFVCTHESQVHEAFKKAFIRAHARDAVISPQLDPRLPVIPVRALSNQAMQDFLSLQRKLIEQLDQEEMTLHEAQMKIEFFWSGALKKAVVDGDIQNGSLMAGQSVGMVKTQESCQEVIQSLRSELLQSIHHFLQEADPYSILPFSSVAS